MAERLGVVGRAFQAFQKRQLDRVFLRLAFDRREQLLHFPPLRQIAGLEAVARGKFAKIRQPIRIGIFVDPVDGRHKRDA